MQYRQRKNLTIQSVDDETLILDLDSNNIHQLNSTASFVWEQCNGSVPVEEVVELFASHYGIDGETARVDVGRVIEVLSELGLIEAA